MFTGYQVVVTCSKSFVTIREHTALYGAGVNSATDILLLFLVSTLVMKRCGEATDAE